MKALFFLFFAASSIRPVVLVPGAMRSRLRMTTARKYKWYCPTNENSSIGWISIARLFPPFINCFLDTMTVDYDEINGSFQCVSNVTITADDFGGLEGIKGTGRTIFGMSTLDYFNTLVRRLIKVGYKPGFNLKGAPYDWRFGITQPKSYFDSLGALIESSFNETGERVQLIAHSLGGYITHRYLTEITSLEWRKKYIDSVTFVAPSWSGAGTSFLILWLQRFPMLPFFKTDLLKNFLGSLGVLHIHVPNTAIYENTTLIIGPDGEHYKGKDIMKLINTTKRLNDNHMKMAKHNFEYVQRFPAAPDVKTNILYNSGRKTIFGLHLKKWDGPYEYLYQNGDHLVGSAGLDWACNNWKIEEGLSCYDVKSPKWRHTHKALLSTKDTVDVILNWLFQNNTQAKYESEL